VLLEQSAEETVSTILIENGKEMSKFVPAFESLLLLLLL
jgi:hypothetical protein